MSDLIEYADRAKLQELTPGTIVQLQELVAAQIVDPGLISIAGAYGAAQINDLPSTCYPVRVLHIEEGSGWLDDLGASVEAEEAGQAWRRGA